MSGLLGQVLGSLLGGGSQSAGMGNAGSGQFSIPQILLQLIANQPGGLAGMVQQFQQAGLGSQVNSWVGTGANMPLDTHQIGNALGDEVVEKMAEHTGLPRDEVLGQISQTLPAMVDGMTPGGLMPEASGNDLLELGMKLLGR
jgi:uncharacterized protein YidB (DUF937 family)